MKLKAEAKEVMNLVNHMSDGPYKTKTLNKGKRKTPLKQVNNWVVKKMTQFTPRSRSEQKPMKITETYDCNNRNKEL